MESPWCAPMFAAGVRLAAGIDSHHKTAFSFFDTGPHLVYRATRNPMPGLESEAGTLRRRERTPAFDALPQLPLRRNARAPVPA